MNELASVGAGMGVQGIAIERHRASVPGRSTAVMVLMILLAFVLRMLYIGGPSLRGDEALSVIYAQRSLADIVDLSRFVSGHPPLFYGSLHFWIKTAGTTELAARFFSAWWGVLAVPLVYVLGRALFGARGATWAALLLAVNPFHIWHAQDIRSYSMLTALSVLSCWAFWRALRHPTSRNWVLYAASGVAVVHCHYFGSFLILSHGLFWFVGTALAVLRPLKIPDASPSIWTGVLSFAAIVASLLPWLWLARSVLAGGHGPGGQTLPLREMFRQGLVTFGVGYWREPWGWGALTLGLALLLGWGAWAAFRLNARGAALLALVVGVPLVCLFVLSRSRPIYRERYLGFSAPAYTLLIGVGLAALETWKKPPVSRRSRARLGRIALAVCVLFLVGFDAYALLQYYVSPRYAKSPEWREAVAFMRERLAPGDVVILNHQDQAFLYYYDDPGLVVLPSPEATDAASVRRFLEDLASLYDRVWLLPDTARLWDQDGLVRQWLDQNSELTLERAWRGVLLLRYHTPRYVEREYIPLDVRLEGGIRLLGYALRDDEGGAVGQLQVRRGGEVRLTLYWLPEARLEHEYVVFAHLLDGTRRLRGQQDNQPRQGTYPTRAWVPGQPVIDAYRVPVAVDTPSGEALLEVGMYDPANGQRLQIGGSDADPEQRRVLLRGVVQID
jgi:4-amino-4-deoxy-L-arabinose transferase-like glycosyltransferase